MSKFKVGDKIEVPGNGTHPQGEILEVEDGYYRVRWNGNRDAKQTQAYIDSDFTLVSSYPPAPFKIGMKVKKGGGEWTVAAREGHPEAKQLDNGRYKLLFEGGYGSAYLDWEPIIEEVSYPPAGFKIGDRVTTSSFRSAERTVVTIEEWLRIGGSQSVVDDREERNSVLCRDDNGYAVHNPASGYKLVETAEAGNVAAYPPAGWNVGDVFTKGFRKDRYVVVSLDEANAGFQRPAPGKAEGWAKDGRLLYRYEDTEHNGKWCYQGSPSEGTKVESAGDRAIAAVFLDRDPVDDPNAVVARFEGDSGWRA